MTQTSSGEKKNREGDGWGEWDLEGTNRCFCSEQYDSTIIPSLQRDISFTTEIAEPLDSEHANFVKYLSCSIWHTDHCTADNIE